MPNYKSMYFHLFNAITTCVNTLQNAQAETEKMYLTEEKEPITLYPKNTKNEEEE